MDLNTNIFNLISSKKLRISNCKVNLKSQVILVFFAPNEYKVDKLILRISQYKQLRAKGLI